MEKSQGQAADKSFLLLKAVFAACVVTAVLLLILTLLMYKAGLGEEKISFGIIVVYLLSTFLGGRIAGKGSQSRKFLWGMLAGIGYFLVLLFLTFAVGQSSGIRTGQLVTTFLMCFGGGMLGGMLSS